MFEKDAEEYSEKDLGGKYLSSVVAKDKLHAYKLGQYDGFLEGAEFGYNKANEWHFVKDELPDHNGQFYVALKGHTETFVLNYDYDEYDESKMVWLDDDDTNFNDEVYAWHEKLKAPKENEK